MADTPQIPIQPVDKPILCSPFQEPTAYWHYDEQGVAQKREGRRPAGYYYLTDRTGTKGTMLPGLIAEENWDDLPLINRLRSDVKRWREKDYENATPTTKALLRHWKREDRPRRLFFCQLEAVETVIYLTEILDAGRTPRYKLELTREDFQALIAGETPKFASEVRTPPTLLDQPIEDHQPGLRRYGCKMATGSGKTVVMAMLTAWSLCNRGKKYSDERFPGSILVMCPNLTVKERLQVLRPDSADNYYQAFDLVPPTLMPELKKGRVLIENWHQLALESEHSEGGKSYTVVQKGEESPEAFAQRVLGDLYGRGPILVFNDEAHHAYRPAPLPPEKKLSADEKDEREEATLWIQGLDRLNQSVGIRFCVDLSATPFYIQGSGYPEGSPFPWLVSDFGLVDAIESGITKIPRIPVSDNTGRPDPKYFALWRYIMDRLKPGEKLPGGKPKPEVMWRESEDALKTLASQWKKTLETIEAAKPGQFRIPPVMIVVCDNTDLANEFYRGISGETTVATIPEDDEDDEDDEDEAPKKKKKGKSKVAYGQGKIFPELLSNREGLKATIRIDSKLLAEAESETPNAGRKEAAKELREVVATVGRPGKPGEQVRCVVSVQMLSEGWDANNVTHILGLRAFGSQLLCEQVLGRGLRRMNYDLNPDTGLLPEEYVDIYGIPFSVIPFKGQSTTKPVAPQPPKNHVYALEERKAFEIRFPVVEGFAFDIRRNKIKADVKGMERLALEPESTPTAVFVKPQVGYTLGGPNAQNNFKFEIQDRSEYYNSVHLQTIQFEIARQIVTALTDTTSYGKPRMQAQGRQELFPQVFSLVREYCATKIDWKDCKPQELGLDRYVKLVVERFLEAIRPDESQGEPPIIPLLHAYRPVGSTSMVDFLTTMPVHAVNYSHLNQVAADTGSWEQAATFALEAMAAEGKIRCFARNERLEFNIPYEFLDNDLSYFPDFLVQVREGFTLILEIKGQEDNQDLAKYETAKRWVRAVNHWGKEGQWGFAVCKDPQTLAQVLEPYLAVEARV